MLLNEGDNAENVRHDRIPISTSFQNLRFFILSLSHASRKGVAWYQKADEVKYQIPKTEKTLEIAGGERASFIWQGGDLSGVRGVS